MAFKCLNVCLCVTALAACLEAFKCLNQCHCPSCLEGGFLMFICLNQSLNINYERTWLTHTHRHSLLYVSLGYIGWSFQEFWKLTYPSEKPLRGIIVFFLIPSILKIYFWNISPKLKLEIYDSRLLYFEKFEIILPNGCCTPLIFLIIYKYK